MGLLRIRMKPGMSASIPAVMESRGLKITRIEKQETRTHYFYMDPKKNRECEFCICTTEGAEYWCCGLSSHATRIAQAFEREGVFESCE